MKTETFDRLIAISPAGWLAYCEWARAAQPAKPKKQTEGKSSSKSSSSEETANANSHCGS